jgi:hypothetical protein
MTNTTTPETPDATPTKRSGARFLTPALALVAAVGIGLFGGVLIGQNTASSTTSAREAGQGGFPGTAGGDAPTGGMGDLTTGTVTAVDGSTVTLELTDGSTVTVTTTDDTTVTTTDESTVDALTNGDSLTVMGDADDDGTVAATSITEGATGFGGRGTGGAATPPASE